MRFPERSVPSSATDFYPPIRTNSAAYERAYDNDTPRYQGFTLSQLTAKPFPLLSFEGKRWYYEDVSTELQYVDFKAYLISCRV